MAYKLWQLEQGVKNATAANDPVSAQWLQQRIEAGDYEEEGMFEYAWNNVKDWPGRIAQGTVDTISTMGEGVADLAEGLTDIVGLESLIDEGADNALVESAREASAASREWLTNERFDEEITSGGMEALGSTTPFLGAAALGMAVAGPPGGIIAGTLAGTLLHAGAQARDREIAKEEGKEVTTSDEWLSRMASVPLGAFETFAPQRILRFMPKSKEAKQAALPFMRKMYEYAVTGSLEGVQEAISGLASDAVARGLYDPDREIGESLASDFGYGTFAGFVLDAAMGSISGRRQRKFYEREKAMRQQKSDEIMRSLEGMDEAEQAEVIQQLPYMPDPEAANSELGRVMAAANNIESSLGESFPLNTEFTSEEGVVVDQDGNPYWQQTDPVEADMIAKRLNEVQQERTANVAIDLAIDQSGQAYTPGDRIGLRLFGKDIYIPSRRRRYDAGQVNFAGNTTDMTGFNESMTAEEALKQGIRPKDMTVAQRINARRIQQGLPETNMFSTEEARAALKADFGNLSDFQYASIPKDEQFIAAKDVDGKPIVISNYGLKMRSRKVTPKGKQNVFEQRNFENHKAAELYAKRLNRLRDKGNPVRRSMLYEDSDITAESINRLLKQKNIDHDINSREVRAIAEMVTGTKARGHSTIKDLTSLYTTLRALPRFSKPRKLPTFGIRYYQPAQYHAARQAAIQRGADTSIKKPSEAIDKAEIESQTGPMSDFVFQAVKRDLDTDQALAEEIEDIRHAERVRQATEARQQARLAKIEPKKQAALKRRADDYQTVLGAIKGLLSGYGLDNVNSRISERIKGAPDPLATEGAYLWKTNEIALAIDALKENPRYKAETTASGRKKVLGELAIEALNHESLHALREADLFTEEEWDILQKQAQKRIKPGTNQTYWEWANETYPDLRSGEQVMEEGIAEMTKDVMSGRLKVGGKPRTLLERIIKFMKSMVGLNTDARLREIMQDIQIGKIGNRPITDAKGEPIIRTYRELARKGYRPDMLESRQPGFPPKQEQDDFLESRRPRDGRQNEEFFTGKAKQASSLVEYRPVIKIDETPEVEAYRKFTDDGNFTGHISKMIAGFAEKQAKVAQGLVRALKVDSFLDIGASEGGLAKTVGSFRPNARVVALDPNPTMRENFQKTPDVYNVEYIPEAFLSDGWEADNGKWVNGYKTDETFDAINEDFTFQFISPDRTKQVAEVKRLLNKDGVFITSEKFHTENSAENERRKLMHQSQYFSPDQLTEDKQTIITGMSDDMINDRAYEEILKNNFHWVAQYWNAGDFKGYIASDSRAKIEKLLDEIGDLSTVYTDANEQANAVFSRRRIGSGENAGKYIGAPDGVNTPQKLGGLLRQITRLGDEGQYGRFWYERSGRYIMRIVNDDVDEADKLVQAIAVTSPNTPVNQNFTYALQAYSQWKAGKPINTGMFPAAMSQRLQAIFSNADWDGRKTNNFYNNLMAVIDPSRVQGATIDIWMMRAFGYWQEKPSDAQYTFVENEVKRIADQLGWEPQQVQAAIWVAAKSRFENPRVKRLTERLSLRNGWIEFGTDNRGKRVRIIHDRKRHFANWRKHAMDHTVTGRDRRRAALDYRDVAEANLAQVSWESRPGRNTGIMPEAWDAPESVIMDYHVAISKALLDNNGTDEIAKLLGLPSPGMFEAPGFFEGDTSPGTQTQVAAPRQFKGAAYGEIEGAAEDLINAYAATIGILLKQQAVGWHRPFFKGVRVKDQNGVEVDIGRALTKQETIDVANLMKKQFGHDYFSPVAAPNGFRLIRWGDDSETAEQTAQLNEEFQDKVDKAMVEWGRSEEIHAKRFHSKNGYLENNWKENANGEGYLDNGLRGRPDLQRRVQDIVTSIKPRIEAVNEEFASQNGWTTGIVYSRRSEQHASRSGGRLPNFSEQGLVLGQEIRPGTATYDGVHFGQQETDVLLGSKNGTGIRGAEQRRLRDSADQRIKNRVYFYIKRKVTDAFRLRNPYMAGKYDVAFARPVRKEPGLGPHVFVQRFANILDPDSPQGVQIVNQTLDNNQFESAVVDAGYDGYASPEQGMMVILNQDVPVQYLGVQTELDRRGTEIGTDREILFPELQATGADAVFSRRGTDAKFRPERLSNVWSEFGYPDGRVVAAVAYVDPDMFVHVTTGKREPADGYQWMKDQTEPLDVPRMASETQTPFLDIEPEGDGWRIIGHEGRHRMSAMSDAGIKRAPVVLKFKNKDYNSRNFIMRKFESDYRESGFDMPEKGELLPQDFARFTRSGIADVSEYNLRFENLTPINWDNMNAVKEVFGDDASTDVVFSRRGPNDGPIGYERVTQPTGVKAGLRRFWYKNFKAQGLLPKDVFDERVTRDAGVSAEELHIGFLNRDLERAVRKAYGKPFKKLSASQQMELKSYLMGEDITATLHPSVMESLDAQRAYLDALSTRMVNSGVVTAEESIKNILDNRGKYLHRSYQVFDDPNWARNVPPDVYEAAFEYLTKQYKAAGQRHDPAFIDGKIGEILHDGTAATGIPNFIKSMSQGKLGTKNVTMLIQRKDIAKPIRDLMGEYHDPRLLFARSATMMQRAVANQLFQTAVKNRGLGVFLFEEPVGEFNMKLAAEGSKGMDILGGLYTTPEIAEAFIEATNPEQFSDTYRKIIAMNALVKYGKTVVAPTTMARNFISAFFFSMANGHANVLTPTFWRNLKNSGSMIGTTMLSKKDRRDYVLHLKRLGVTLDNPYAGEMIGMINDSAMLPAYQKGAKRNIKNTMDFFTRLYQYGDDFWKVIGFESEKAALIKYANMSEADAEVEAAKRIRNTYPTYSLVGKGIKRLRRFPLAGTFVSFPAEIIRTAGNIVSQTAEDLRSPNTRPMAIRRMAGMTVAGAWAHVAAAISMAMMGIDDEDDEAVRKLGPPWSRNSNLLYAGYDESGFPQFFDISYTDPYNYLKRPLNALMTKGDAAETLKSLALDVGGPFVGPDIAATALFETIFNKKLDGGRVFNPNGPIDEQAQEAFKHIWGSIQPGVAGNIERMYKASKGDSSTYGKKYKMEDEVSALFGLRKMTLSPLLGLGFKGFDYVDGMRNAQAILDRVVSGQNIVKDKEIMKKFEEMMISRERVARRFIEQISMTSGFSGEQNVWQLLLSVVPSKVDAQELMTGRVPQWRFTGNYMQKARERLIAMTPPGQRQEAMDRLKHRIELVSKLYQDYYGL